MFEEALAGGILFGNEVSCENLRQQSSKGTYAISGHQVKTVKILAAAALCVPSAADQRSFCDHARPIIARTRSARAWHKLSRVVAGPRQREGVRLCGGSDLT